MKQSSSFSPSKLFWQIATGVGLVILITQPLGLVSQMLGVTYHPSTSLMVATVEASEIYDMFTCPCCNEILKKEEPCCGAMAQMIDFIDQRITAGSDRDTIILATVREFGLERLASPSDREALREQLIANAPADSPQLSILDDRKNLGSVSLSDEVVTTDFVIQNTGQSELVIDRLSSSCDCTSGSVIYQGVEGPRFYMAGHGYDEPDPNWQAAIAPGDQAVIRVYYDPTVHPDLIGPVTRTISVHSNDPVDFDAKVTVTLEQTP